MVLSRPRISRMEIEGVPLVDPRKTYVFDIAIVTLALTAFYSDSWLREEHAVVSATGLINQWLSSNSYARLDQQ
jgi:hypothetical protein